MSVIGQLGFGCAYLLTAALTLRQAQLLLEASLDNGVRHFDTARMYGDGRAEAILGSIAKHRRDEMVIVSKAGILPPSLISRALRYAFAALGRDTRGLGEAQKGAFEPQQVRRSVETSLRALQTDHVDALLLHEIHARDVSDGLKREVEQLRQEGKILRCGVATSAVEIMTIAAAHPELCEIAQIPASPWGKTAAQAPDGAMLITHSVLGARLESLLTMLADDPALARRFENDIGLAPDDREGAAELLLQQALADNPDGVTLFSSTRSAHIARNAEAARSVNAAQLAALTAFVRQLPSVRVCADA